MSQEHSLIKTAKRSNQDSQGPKKALTVIAKVLFSFIMLLTTIWAGLVLWVHLADYAIGRWLGVVAIALLGMMALKQTLMGKRHWQKWLTAFVALWVPIALWFAWLPPKQDRDWKPEVSQVLQFTQSESNPNLITLHNVRNFDWVRAKGSRELIQPTQPYYYKAVEEEEDPEVVAQERWSERTVDLSKLSGVDIINSYWMGEQIGHTLLSFRFEDERPLSFSIEIRKQQQESFSAVGGFVKQFELAVVASEERDIVYTRSNVRGEQVYMLPIKGLTQQQVQQLFMAYLQRAKGLQQQPKWYNTLTKNCTTVIFDMARKIDPQAFPWDYRILMSGYVPNYLYDEGLLPEQLNGARIDWDIEQWYVNSHINPKVADFSFEDNQNPEAYSQIIRQGLPQPALVP